MTKILLGTFKFLPLLYHSIVKDIRGSDGNALRGLAMEIMQMMMMVAVFYFPIIG